jgi:aminoglycoside phosphotransferase family enzyme
LGELKYQAALKCTKLVYIGVMAPSRQVRRSVTLPTRLAEQVERIAKKRRLSDNRVLVELVEQGLEVEKEKEKAFFALAERFRAADDPKEVKQLGDQMGRFIFGE